VRWLAIVYTYACDETALFACDDSACVCAVVRLVYYYYYYVTIDRYMNMPSRMALVVSYSLASGPVTLARPIAVVFLPIVSVLRRRRCFMHFVTNNITCYDNVIVRFESDCLRNENNVVLKETSPRVPSRRP